MSITVGTKVQVTDTTKATFGKVGTVSHFGSYKGFFIEGILDCNLYTEEQVTEVVSILDDGYVITQAMIDAEIASTESLSDTPPTMAPMSVHESYAWQGGLNMYY